MPVKEKEEMRRNGEALLASARRTRESAVAFAAVVARFGRDMPGHLDAFHAIMTDFRATAARIRRDDGADGGG